VAAIAVSAVVACRVFLIVVAIDAGRPANTDAGRRPTARSSDDEE
jgi:hypothetical protein